MIEKVYYKKRLLALIVRRQFRKKKGINFFTPKETTQQFGYMKHKKGHIVKPHRHNKRLTKIIRTTEVILLLKGSLRADFYNEKKKYLFSKIIKANDIITLIQGSHGFKTIEPLEMLEVKQGPFQKNNDKIKFKKVDEREIKIK